MSIAAVIGSSCCCGCCSVLAGAPDYIDVELTFTSSKTARICNPDIGSFWTEGDIVFEESLSGSLKTRLKKVLVEGCWTYECPPIDDPERIFSATLNKSETHYLACFDPIAGVTWYGETYNESWTYAVANQPGCLAFSVTVGAAPGGCEICFTLQHSAESGTTYEWECGECNAPGVDSGSESSGLPIAGGALILTGCRSFANAGELLGAMTSCENPFAIDCPCPQTTCSGPCFFADYPAAIKTCMAVGSHDVAICDSSSCGGAITEVP